jgi:hypothetical protein
VDPASAIGFVVETSQSKGVISQILSPDIHPRFILLSQNPIMLAMPRN